MTTGDWLTLAGIAAGLVSLAVNSWTNLRVAHLKTKVEEVHVAVNSERSKMLEDMKSLLSENNLLKGADAERIKTDATAATFEAGRKEGAENKGV